MTREEFSEALLRFGADLGRWPEPEAAAARRLLDGDPGAAELLADHARFERTLAEAVEPPPFGAAEIGAVLAARDREQAAWWPAPRVLLAGAGVSALCFVLGFVTVVAITPPQDIPVPVVALALGQEDFGGLL
jgi:hypothetical protein